MYAIVKTRHKYVSVGNNRSETYENWKIKDSYGALIVQSTGQKIWSLSRSSIFWIECASHERTIYNFGNFKADNRALLRMQDQYSWFFSFPLNCAESDLEREQWRAKCATCSFHRSLSMSDLSWDHSQISLGFDLTDRFQFLCRCPANN